MNIAPRPHGLEIQALFYPAACRSPASTASGADVNRRLVAEIDEEVVEDEPDTTAILLMPEGTGIFDRKMTRVRSYVVLVGQIVLIATSPFLFSN